MKSPQISQKSGRGAQNSPNKDQIWVSVSQATDGIHNYVLQATALNVFGAVDSISSSEDRIVDSISSLEDISTAGYYLVIFGHFELIFDPLQGFSVKIANQNLV